MARGTEGTFVQAWPDRARELELHRRAAEHGLAPRILDENNETVTFERLPRTLKRWWEANDEPAARAGMKAHLK